MKFRPKIIGFICNWSLPAEIGAPSTFRIHGYPRIRIVRVMCLGRIDPVILVETFAKGADGVFIAGCHPPDCHYVEGNLHAERVVKMLKRLIALTGLEPERIAIRWYSPQEKEGFGNCVKEFSESIGKLGPSPLESEKPESELWLSLFAAKNAASDSRLRTLLGREKELTDSVNAYGKRISPEEFDNLLGDVVEAEFIRHRIVLSTKKPLSVKELANTLNMKPSVVLRHILNLRRKGIIALDRVQGTTPLYKASEVL
jgi:NADH-quinone oxidoreductase subunit E